MKVQQGLLRHPDIRTTINIYTPTVSPALREANSKVVRMILPEGKTAEIAHKNAGQSMGDSSPGLR
jgi:hypothetical protein